LQHRVKRAPLEEGPPPWRTPVELPICLCSRVMGELLLGIALMWIAGFWVAGIVQMRRAGYHPAMAGMAVGIHAALAVGFVGGLVLVISATAKL
jgi:hypothetical protein